MALAPCFGSNVAPWHGQISRLDDGSYSTSQPAWVQVRSNATTLPLGSSSTALGSPVVGSAKPRGRSCERWLMLPMTVPVGGGVAAAATGSELASADAAGVGRGVGARRRVRRVRRARPRGRQPGSSLRSAAEDRPEQPGRRRQQDGDATEDTGFEEGPSRHVLGRARGPVGRALSRVGAAPAREASVRVRAPGATRRS